MKKLIYNFWIIMLFIVFGGSAYAQQDRNVIWVHGFTGDASAWEHYANIFQNERKIQNFRDTHNTTSGISAATTYMFVPSYNNESNIGIGHSMGGVMIRYKDRLGTSLNVPFGGYITVASPNYGAPISNSILDGSVNSAAATAANKITAGPLFMSFGLPWTIVSDWTTKKVADLFLNCIDFTTTTTNNDLKVGSSIINNLNAYTSSAHRIALIAQENSPVHWRMISGKLPKYPCPSSIPCVYFTESEFITLISNIRGVYQTNFNFHESMHFFHLGLFTFNPIAALYHKTAKNKWREGMDWIDDSETIWCQLIGTTKTEWVTYWTWVWNPCPDLPLIGGGPGVFLLPPDDPYACDIWIQKQVSGYKQVIYPSDGLLPVYTQELVGVSGNDRYLIDYANHYEVKDMSNSKLPNGQSNNETERILREIFSRQQPSFFNTPTR